METQATRRSISKGICTFCKTELAKNKMTQHLKSCKQRLACAGYLGHPFEKIGMVCLIDHISLPKQVRCQYHERDACCSRKGCEKASTRDRGRRR